MILPKLFPKPTIKSLSGARRNWAKSQKLYLTADNRIAAKKVIQKMKYLDLQIRQTIPLVRSFKNWTICTETLIETEVFVGVGVD